MARTYHKAKMEDISLFSASAVFEELELFNPYPALEENGFLDEYDVYSFIEDPGVKPPPSLLAEDLLHQFEIEAGNGLLDADWMTEKLEFNNAEPSVPFQETDTFVNLGGVDLTTLEVGTAVKSESENTTSTLESMIPVTANQPAENIFANVDEILKRLCADKKILFTEEQPDGPSSPSQSVPDVEMNNLKALLSPKSDVSDESTSLACSEEDSFSCPSSPETPVKQNVRTSPTAATRPKPTHFAPYSKEKPAKVRSPQQKKRKREQNKDAATRYRIKKREEQDTVEKELTGLEKDNVELKEQVTSLSKEIEYLKNLMLEVYKTKLQKHCLLVS